MLTSRLSIACPALAGVLLVALFAVPRAGAQDTDPVAASAPQAPGALTYQLQPGMELSYEGSSQTKGSFTMTGSQKTQAWVLAKNEDGSFRTLIQMEMTYSHGDGGGQPRTMSEIIIVNVSPSGRLSQATVGHLARPAQLFPLLPEPDQRQWQAADAAGDTTIYRLGGAAGPGKVTIEADSRSAMKAIYGIKEQWTFVFDTARGLVESGRSEQEQTYRVRTQGAGKLDLKSVTMRDEAFIRTLDQESRIYLKAQKGYLRAMQGTRKDGSEVDAARDALVQLAAKLTMPALKERLQADLEQHDQMAAYAKTSAAARANRLNQPAPEWDLHDLAGERHRLLDYRGKVVVLDFWHRGCGWCILAMPQLKQLAEDFQDQPVAILGMNIDRNTEHPRFVAEKMQLNYPTLLGVEVPAQYSVSTFPTLLLIDQRGIVRAIHEGWSPTLREDVAAKIQELLKAPENPEEAKKEAYR